MKDATRNILTGLAGIVALLGFAYLLMIFGEISGIRAEGWPLKIAINDAGGVREGSVVTLNGVPVGSVRDVSVTEDPAFPVLIVAAIDGERRLPTPLTPSIEASLIGGGATLGLRTIPGVTTMTSFYPIDGSFTIEGQHVDLAERLTRTLGQEAQRLADSLGTFREGFEKLASTYATLGSHLDELVEPIDPAKEGEGVANLRITILKLNRTLDEARAAMVDARAWLGDDQLRVDVTETLRDVRSAVAEVGSLAAEGRVAVRQYGDLAESLRGNADTLTGRLIQASDELAATLRHVQSVATLASSGDGTISRLLNRPELYLSLLDSSQRLERALEETRVLIRKIREEGLRLDLK
jgi:hypothetical protein